MYACTTKNWGPRSVTYFRGVPKFVTKCDRGIKIGPNSMTYIMDGPLRHDDVIRVAASKRFGWLKP